MNDSPIFKVQKNKEKIYNIENIKIYFVLISFNSLLATETFIHFDWSFEQKKSQNNKNTEILKCIKNFYFSRVWGIKNRNLNVLKKWSIFKSLHVIVEKSSFYSIRTNCTIISE